MANYIFWISFFLILYVYILYPVIIYLLQLVVYHERYTHKAEYTPPVSIIVAAFNEEKHITRRLQNLFDLAYPRDKMEIIVASDGSTDRTVAAAAAFPGVTVLAFPENRGKAAVHNDAARQAKHEILVFTDAETEFAPDFLSHLLQPLRWPRVGATVGNLSYRGQNGAMAASEGLFFQLEKLLRLWESRLGLLATATGACMAVRRRLWQDLGPIDDSDFTTPLDVILQGSEVVYVQAALAFDNPPTSVRGEFQTRVRQTSRNLAGTLQRWGWRGWLSHPLVSWGLLSHKLLRWFTPFFFLTVLVANLALLRHGLLYQAFFLGQLAFYTGALLGWQAERHRRHLKLASTIFSFCVACAGMGVGVLKGLAGKAPARFGKNEG